MWKIPRDARITFPFAPRFTQIGVVLTITQRNPSFILGVVKYSMIRCRCMHVYDRTLKCNNYRCCDFSVVVFKFYLTLTTPLLNVSNGSRIPFVWVSKNKSVRSCSKAIKSAKDTTLEGEMQIINPYLLTLRLLFTKNLKLGDPNESLRRSNIEPLNFPKYYA